MRSMPNPVWIKKSAVSPRNYNATKHTPVDSQRMYSHAARANGKTLGDLLQECKMEELRRRLIYVK